MTFRNFYVEGAKGMSYEQRDLDIQKKMTVQLKIPICCSCAYFLLIRGKQVVGGRGIKWQGKLAMEANKHQR